jgi:hypothetical protein
MPPIPVDKLETIKTHKYSTMSLVNDPNVPYVYHPQKAVAADMFTSHHITNAPAMVDFAKKAATSALCVRRVTNWAKLVPANKFDKKTFNAEATLKMIKTASPKMTALFENIKKLDEEDMATHGRHFKHFIYSDVKSMGYGAKIIAASFLAMGFKLAYNKSLQITNSAGSTADNTFALLCSTPVYDKTVGVKVRKAILEEFNKRPSNSHGEKIRFIILDNGFKEGVDLFDVKYVHLFEPLVTNSDQKQAIGRGTRFCGQKGIEFNPTLGWPLHVYKYDVSSNGTTGDNETLFKMYMNMSGIDLRLLKFASAIEELTVIGAVDRPLTKSIHRFVISDNAAEADTSMGLNDMFASPKGGARLKGGAKAQILPLTQVPAASEFISPGKSPFTVSIPSNFFQSTNVVTTNASKSMRGVTSTVSIPSNMFRTPKALIAPTKIMPTAEMRKFVLQNYGHLTWPDVEMKNMCGPAGGDGAKKSKKIVDFTPTQEFVRNFFSVNSAYKGMLLYHSVGSGKTCSAIATASSSFEEAGYTIMYVTRHTLKADMWKNMFDQVCNVVLQEKLKDGKLADADLKDVKQPSKFIKGWLPPVSFKQFTNMLLKKNDLYKTMVGINGTKDVLKKTLVIIDEAHKMYDPNTSAMERPDVEVLYKMIQESYKLSGEDSVRVLAMTGTPYTNNPMDMVSLLNLLRLQDAAIPATFDAFSATYLGPDGEFTKKGSLKYLNDISGYVSYLNREKDARQFAHPVMHDVVVPMTTSASMESTNKENEELMKNLESLEEQQLKLVEDWKLEKLGKLEEIKNTLEEGLNECKAVADKAAKKECVAAAREEAKKAKSKLTADHNLEVKASKAALSALKKAAKKKVSEGKKTSVMTQDMALRVCGAPV